MSLAAAGAGLPARLTYEVLAGLYYCRDEIEQGQAARLLKVVAKVLEGFRA